MLPQSDLFDEWNNDKKTIHQEIPESFFVNEREIWYTKLGINIGNESNGKKDFRRPVLILKKVGNMFFIVPMTTKGKESPFYYEIKNCEYLPDYSTPIVQRAQLSQARIIDKRRFLDRIGTISQDDFKEVQKRLRALLL